MVNVPRDAAVKPQKQLCAFELPSSEGTIAGPAMYRLRSHLVLLFLHDTSCGACQLILRGMARHYAEVRKNNAEVLAIIGGDVLAATQYHFKQKIPFVFLFDADDHAASLCLADIGMFRPSVLLVDRYGAIWKELVPQENDGELEVREALKWLEFMEMQCPECDVSDEPPVE